MQFTSKNLALLAAAASLTNALPTTKQVKRGFNADGSNNVASWWGNSNTLTPLADICKDSTNDIVILTFAGYSGGKWTTAGNTAAKADIQSCQSAGKKVLMSIGGETGAIVWSSADEAKKAADSAATEFLSSSGSLGIALDGIDLDIENKQPAHWDDFTKELRSKMKDGQYISAAPQCPSPDASLPFSVLDLVDFVWVQYYNNPGCGHGSSGFADSVKDWSSKLTKAKLYIGTPGSKDSAGSGYIEPDALTKEIAQVQGMNLKNFGGYAFWDASTAKKNNDYAGVAKKALGGGSSGSSSPSSGSSPSSAPAQTGAPTATSASGPKVTGTKTHHNQGPSATGGAATGGVTVQATSTAHVTSTAFVDSSAPSATGSSDASASEPATAAPTGTTGSSDGTTQACDTAGAIVCSSDGSKFGMCYNGSAVMMAVSAGTTCSGGKINSVAAPSS